MSKMEKNGMEKLAKVLDSRMVEHSGGGFSFDFGVIKKDYSLVSNTFPLPTGSSKLIVKSATVKTVDFACTGLVLDGVGLDDVISTFKTEMMAVYSAAKETNILRYNSARTVLSTITGVSDFIDFTMDGKRENIHLSSSEYADTGNVTFTLEGAET